MKSELNSLLYKAEAGIFYHQRLCRRYDRYVRAVNVINVVLSAGIFISVLDTITKLSQIENLTLYTTASLAFVNIVSFAYDFGGRAHTHAGLAKDWQAQKLLIKESLTQTDNKKLQEAVRRCREADSAIDQREPPMKLWLGHWAEVKAARALGKTDPNAPWPIRKTAELFHR